MNQSEQINELAAALSKAQGKIGAAIKDSTNPFFKSKYADLSSIWNACKSSLSEHGLAVLQTMEYKDSQMILVTTLAHSSGQWIRSCLPILPTKNDAQGIGSAITYMRRYSLAAMVGVTTDDDDGNDACVPNHNAKAQSYTVPAHISVAQAKELQAILHECAPSYQKNFWAFLKNEVKGIENIEQLPVAMYERIKSGIMKKREEYLKELLPSSNEVAYA